MGIAPDTKDWTWVIETACPECGFDAAGLALTDVPELIRATAAAWPAVLARPDVRIRPAADTWSALEYGCHVRDACRVFADRLTLMLTQDDPLFANWDQDEAAEQGRYGEQDPAQVAADLQRASAGVERRVSPESGVSSGSGPDGGPTARSSRCRRWPGTSSMTRCTTCTTSPADPRPGPLRPGHGRPATIAGCLFSGRACPTAAAVRSTWC